MNPFEQSSRAGRNQQGLSLLEIVIAMAVVFLALLGFAGFSVVAHTGMSASEKMTRAVTLAQEKMEEVEREGVSAGLLGSITTTESYGSITGALPASTCSYYHASSSDAGVTYGYRERGMG